MSREAIMRWVGSAPLPVVLSICLTTSSALAGWVWVVADEVHTQRADVAIARLEARNASEDVAAKALDIKEAQTDARAELRALNAKMDQLLEAVADLKAAEKARAAKEKNR